MFRTPSALDDRGVALLLALVLTALLTALAASLVVSTSVEGLISGSYRSSQEAFYAADAGLERAISDLSLLPDWTPVLALPPANLRASFDDGSAGAVAPDGRPLSFPLLTAERQATSDATAGGYGADKPVWRLHAHASLQSILPPGLLAPPAYVLLWVADDGEDGDGDAAKDSNGIVLVCAEAYGLAGARRRVEASIARAAPGGIRLLAWKDPR